MAAKTTSRRASAHNQQGLEAKLAALDGPEWDSDNTSDDEKEEILAMLETKTTTTKDTKIKVTNNKNNNDKKDDDGDSSSSAIYIGHLPREFEEPELRGFLSQFGDIPRLRLSRSKKTGNSRGYAFVEFASPNVAQIVAETLGGYFLGTGGGSGGNMTKRLVCHVLPNAKATDPRLFKGPKGKAFRFTAAGKQHAAAVAAAAKAKSSSSTKKQTNKLIRQEQKKRKALEALGIDYDFPGYKASAEKMKAAASKDVEEKVKEEEVVDKQKQHKKKKRESSPMLLVEQLEEKCESSSPSEKKRAKKSKSKKRSSSQ